MAISFEKLQTRAPELVNLAKKAQFNLSKHDLEGHAAKVALCLDHSGSMRTAYASGQMQALAERVLALGTQLDDDGAIDVFFFGTEAWHAGELTLDDYVGGVDRLRAGRHLGLTDYAGAIRAVREHYGLTDPGATADLPVYVLFLTDGAPTSRTAATNELRDASGSPVFWKFLSIGSEDIPFLQKLDDLTDRVVDNADYQPVGDLAAVKDQALFDLLLVEYPEWLAEVRGRGILR
ncbi:VWA domain-containing protein [Cellulomonas sp. NPDC055163]